MTLNLGLESLDNGELDSVWTVHEQADIEELTRIQESLARRVNYNDRLGRLPESLCGLDAAYSGNNGVGAASLARPNTGEIVETPSARMKGLFSYHPGLLGFREGPLLVEAASKLNSRPDVYIV